MRGVALLKAESLGNLDPQCRVFGYSTFLPSLPGRRRRSGGSDSSNPRAVPSLSSTQVLLQKGCERSSSGSARDARQQQPAAKTLPFLPARLGGRGDARESEGTCPSLPESPGVSGHFRQRHWAGRRGCALCPFPGGCLLSICLPHILSSFLFASHIIAFINRLSLLPIWAFGFSAHHG